MPEAALFITWGQPVRGRERRANDQLRESVRYWRRLREEGWIERFDWAVLPLQGSELWGFALLRGAPEQLGALRGSEEFGRWVLRVSLVADRVGVFDATVDPDRLARTMDLYDETVAGLD